MAGSPCVASFQPLAGVIRVHGPGGGYGDDYTWSCSVTIVDGVAHLYGVLRAPRPSEWRAVAECLRNHGCSAVKYERMGKRTVVAKL